MTAQVRFLTRTIREAGRRRVVYETGNRQQAIGNRGTDESPDGKEIYMELKDTVEMMLSEDYQERFKAEYFQLKIRLQKLEELIYKAEQGKLDFKLKCPLPMLRAQRQEMGALLLTMFERACMEGIDVKC